MGVVKGPLLVRDPALELDVAALALLAAVPELVEDDPPQAASPTPVIAATATMTILRNLSTYTKAEVTELERVLGVMLDAVAATPTFYTDDEFIASGWPQRIQPIAARALATMLGRGRFREDVEEDAASLGPRPNRWPRSAA
ncbi:MAG: hypothetical protein ACRDNS_33840 [Trebonia sp.]